MAYNKLHGNRHGIVGGNEKMNQYLVMWDLQKEWKRIPLFEQATEMDSLKLPENLFSLSSDKLNKKQKARLIGIIKRSVQ